MAEKIYGNTPCFLGAKNISADSNTDGVDVVVYGVPWEGAVTWGEYTGCELGPKVMRLCSARYTGYLPELNHIDVFEHMKLGDMGDVDVIPADVMGTVKRIEEFSGNVWSTGKFPVALGGDHGITYPIVNALTKQVKGKVGIIHLDAHYDNKPHHEGDAFARCSPFARLYECEGVRNESIVHAGIHGPRNAPDNGKLAQEVGATTITVRDIREHGNLKQLAKQMYDIASQGTEAVYLSICSDVMDFAFNPGGPADCNGLTSYELLTLVYELCKLGVIGMDFVEVYPQQDPNQFSAHFASTLVLYALAGTIWNKEEKAKKEQAGQYVTN
ncbi:agmatinase family protein [Aneurinibacillus migulanus]|uniref:Agmatinase n=1 Tax=Aneurinibacillus migulanus TaxID=47500 RepID=A0A0D1YC53_ANEMI|nr:agmatinase family protein [Aneurinibacillus migulanus]KIV56637.1 agmatinase [Aneurinibacillus migulanus]KON95398.1 agmatinase [Aneurinibacillus migulanus]MED0893648.1 agmatinase family protein [Aneurinibacillus migulanus]MED1617848.1 agmatinase family protein [Aneurinibacillus migulanus]MED4728473.1 agmatinase family protein [Aneurinibacillus migulanus]